MSMLIDVIREDIPLWHSCLDTAFVRGVATGTLSEDCFKSYIVDDSLYLREYAKVFAYGMIHAKTSEEIRAYYSLLAFVNESEDATRLYYMKRYGLTDADIQHLPLRPANRAYVDTMLSAARDGEGAPECMMACLPCMLSYAYIFGEILRDCPQVRDTVYWPFVRDYADGSYDAVCREWMEFTERVCQELSPEREAKCREIFHRCSVHEHAFWEMCEQPRDDI